MTRTQFRLTDAISNYVSAMTQVERQAEYRRVTGDETNKPDELMSLREAQETWQHVLDIIAEVVR